ncbi:MAG: hypothetical protein HZA90_19645 [Verrucomicrobia bacterium]|nr:hypothetical protein [Verrucomicrobiota bacterium]
MKQILLLGGVAALLVIALLMGLVLWAYLGSVRQRRGLYAKIKPVIADLEKGRVVPTEQLEQLAADAETRNLLRRELQRIGRSELFPQRYGSLAAMAESDLVVWLLHPNELAAKPDQIEVAKVIERQEGTPSKTDVFFVFRFRTLPPHWHAKDGWMAGVAGPYVEGEDDDRLERIVFSRFEAFDKRTPEEHLVEIEKLVSRK